jgi:hypothetical protein
MKMEKIVIIAIITIIFSAGICIAAEEYAKDPAASAQSGKIENTASNTTLPQ